MRRNRFGVMLSVLLAMLLALGVCASAEQPTEEVWAEGVWVEDVEGDVAEGVCVEDVEEGVAEVGDLSLLNDIGDPEGTLGDPAVASPNAVANDGASVAINSKYFPAKDFREYVKANFDVDGDGSLSTEERDAVEEILLRTLDDADNGINEVNCSTLKGIEYFTNLRVLHCACCGLAELDVSKNTRLEYVECGLNSLKKLNVSKNKELEWLSCFENKLKKLDVSKNRKLLELWCFGNALTKIDVSNNTKLLALDVGDNQITALDVSMLKNLELLRCGPNRLKKLDVSRNKKLRELWCYNNKLTKLNVKKNRKLELMLASGNAIKQIDITN